jgi:hypothetical protein
MPTLLNIEGFRFYFFSNEGTEPAHVHVEKGDGTAKFWLNPVSGLLRRYDSRRGAACQGNRRGTRCRVFGAME